MKHLLIFTSIFLLMLKAEAQNVGIGTTTPTTILDVNSTSQGVLIPRMTTTQMKAIASPASGLLITNMDSANRVFIYTGTSWKGLAYTDETGGTFNNNLFVHKAGTETITGIKTFTTDILVNGLTVGKGKGNTGSNSALGVSTLFSNTTGGYNTATGNLALFSNTKGDGNTANGYQALASNITGSTNTAIGYFALPFNTNGSDNTAIGNQSLFSNTTGKQNAGLGDYTLFNNTTGIQNAAFGGLSLYTNTTGRQNVALGNQALYSNIDGQLNTVSGYRSLYYTATGSYNLASGANAGIFISGGIKPNTAVDNSIFLGANTMAQANNQTNQIVIGHGSVGDGSNTTVLGNTSTVSTKLFGKLKLQGYGAGTNTGTPAYNLATDATGNIIEVTLGSGGGGASRITPTALSDGSDITWDIATTATTNSEITLTGSNRNLNIINPVAGEMYRIKIIQDASGFRTIANWPANTKWEGGSVPTLTITSNGYDIITFYYDGTNFNGNAHLNYN